MPTAKNKNHDFVYIIFTSLQTAIVQVKNGAGAHKYIQPIVNAIRNQDQGVPQFIVGAYNIRSRNDTPIHVHPNSPYTHHQIFVSFEEDNYNVESINAWKDEFIAWTNSHTIQQRFKFPPTFVFGGYINAIEDPHHLAQHLLDGDVQNILSLLYEGEEMRALMADDNIRSSCFGDNATYEEVATRILMDE